MGERGGDMALMRRGARVQALVRATSLGAALALVAGLAGPIAGAAPGAAAPGGGASSTAAVTIDMATDNSLPIQAGTVVQAGYDVAVPASTHPASTVSVSTPLVVLHTLCSKGPAAGSAVDISIPIPNGSYDVPQGDTSWKPTASSTDASGYQGRLTVPASYCSGGSGQLGNGSHGATFTASVGTTDPSDPTNIRFHVDKNQSGAWSSAVSAQASITNLSLSTTTPDRKSVV